MKITNPNFQRFGDPLVLSPKDERDAYVYWLHYHFPHRDVEEEILPFFTAAATQPDLIRMTRKMLFLSQDSVAKKLGVKRQAIARFESAEESGTITLECLRALRVATPDRLARFTAYWVGVLQRESKFRVAQGFTYGTAPR